MESRTTDGNFGGRLCRSGSIYERSSHGREGTRHRAGRAAGDGSPAQRGVAVALSLRQTVPGDAVKNRTGLLSLALATGTFLLFLPVRHNEFLNWDDLTYLANNDHVRGGLTWEGFK